MRANNLKKLWGEGRKTINAWCGIPAAFSAESMAHQGFDSVTVDMQHGIVDYQTMVTMLQAISTTEVVPMVRVPWREPGIIMKSLDAGAYGVICPMVNTREQAQELVSYCNYAPKGSRSFGPVRALIYGGADYPSHANDEVLAIAMIETREALDNLDSILSVEGLDGIYVGPADLAISLGKKPGFDPTDEVVVGAIETIIKGANRHGVRAGIHCGAPAYAKKMMEIGFDFATLLSDQRMMTMKAAEVVSEMRERPAGQVSSTY